MPTFNWDRQVTCRRYHTKIKTSQCIARYRTGDIGGCLKCTQGKKRIRKYNVQMEKDLEDIDDTQFFQRVRDTLRELAASRKY